MLKNPQDRRAMRTAMQIKETMFSFLESKAIHEISVAQICRECQINRATFYDHYRDVFDLVQDMESDILRQLRELMETVTPEETPSDVVSQLFFAFLGQRRQQMKVLLNGERSREFSRRLDEQIMPFFERKARAITASLCRSSIPGRKIRKRKPGCAPCSAMPVFPACLKESRKDFDFRRDCDRIGKMQALEEGICYYRRSICPLILAAGSC